mmetsp:Transcript_12499/g.27340  ORF Transcript_12499/g.27340 Transcript_12499/m.27340 type:complete len:234 (-) Transcript_12499:2978-3679(-)
MLLPFKEMWVMDSLSTRASERAAIRLSSKPVLLKDRLVTTEFPARASTRGSASGLCARSVSSRFTSVRCESLALTRSTIVDSEDCFGDPPLLRCDCREARTSSISSNRSSSTGLPVKSRCMIFVLESKVPIKYSQPSEVILLSLNEMCVMDLLSTSAKESVAIKLSSKQVLLRDKLVTCLFAANASRMGSASGLCTKSTSSSIRSTREGSFASRLCNVASSESLFADQDDDMD